MLRFTSLITVAAGLLLQAAVASAFPSLPAAVTANYPSATNLETCGTCHTSFTSAPGLNPYGSAFLAANGLADPAAAMTAIEGDDSDGDGTSNIDEINTDAGFFPGWTCASYVDAQNAPVDLANLVDPVDPGCNGPDTTTTTVVVTTTTTTGPVTTTTIPVGEPTCGDPVAPYDGTVATDCLYILNAAIQLVECADCLCDPVGNNGVNSTDALLCLKVSVGDPLPLDCPACTGATTTTTSAGGTTTTTAGPATTTTTAAAGTTTTTAAAGTTTTTAAAGTTTTTVLPG